MEKFWKLIDWDSCPECGDAIEVYTDAPDDLVCDSDEARCAARCGYESAMSVDEDGSAWLQD